MVMHVQLQAACSALGYTEGTHYVKEPDCLETVKELLRFLRREDDTCDIRRQLGHAQILQKDLLPLVKQHNSDKQLFDTVIRLLVNLTQPVLVCFNNELPDEKTLRQFCLEIESHLQMYKEAFVDEALWTVLRRKLSELLELDWERRLEEDRVMLERLLVLVRNVLHVPPDPATEQRTDDDASLHDQVLWAIHVSGMEDLLLYIASSDNERQLCMHILEIVSLMFREQSPEVLAFAGVQRSSTEKEKDERELEMALSKERAMKQSNSRRFNTRHSNFGGTFVMKNSQSLSDRDLIYHKPLQDADNFTLDSAKKRRKKAKNRAPIKDAPVIRRSTLSIRLGLKELCVQFLENAYNPLMYAVKDSLVREASQELDETYYLWAMHFFMQFCRHHSSHVDFISETMSVATFHYIYNNLLRYYEMILVEKKEAAVWGRRVHLALKAYQELLNTLDMMDRSSNSHLVQSAGVIKSNVFYMMEFRDIFVTLLKKFNESKNSRAYLKDLVETTHLFLRMLERCTKGANHLVVRGNKRRKRKKNKKATAGQAGEPSEVQLEDSWQEMSSQLSALLQGREEVPQDALPFDAASDLDDEQQRTAAMVAIHSALRQGQAGQALALFRAAREVWPAQDQFGSQNISAEEEFLALREVFMAPLPAGPNADLEANQEMEEEAQQQEEEEEHASRADWEQEFDFNQYLMNFAKPEIVKAYVVLAGEFEQHGAGTIHCVVKMLHRLAFDLGLHAMLFQASLFRVFQKLLLGPAATSSTFQELRKFAVHVVRKFFEVANKNKKVFVEMMFWKGSKEAMQITEGYDYQPGKAQMAWTEQEENELMRLFEDFRDTSHPEKDAVDLIMDHWTGRERKRGQFLRQLRCMHLIQSVKDLHRGARSSRAWTQEEEDQLKQLYEEHKDSDDPLSAVQSLLGTKRSRGKVRDKLLALGLVQERRQLYKKRSSGKPRPPHGTGPGGEQEGAASSDEERHGDGRLPSDEDILSSPTASEGDGSDDDDDEEEEEEAGSQPGRSVPGGDAESATTSLLDTINSLIAKGYTDQIRWIQQLLSHNADNRQGQDKVFAVPVVPLTEDREAAMEDPTFTALLHTVGLTPPASHQEMFWRIPACLTADTLRRMAEALEVTEDGTVADPHKLAALQTSLPRHTSADTNHTAKNRSRAKKRADRARRKRQRERAAKSRKERESSAGDSEGEGEGWREAAGSGEEEAGAGRASSTTQRRTARGTRLLRHPATKSSRATTQPARAEEEGGCGGEGSPGQQRSHRVKASPGPARARKRVRTLMDSHTDSDGDEDRLLIEADRASCSSGGKPSKRIRLLASDSSDQEDMDTSAVRYQSEEAGDGGGGSQGASQGLLDLGASDQDSEDQTASTLQQHDATSSTVPPPESFPATLFSQGPPDSDDSDLDDHVTLGALKKRRVAAISDDEDP